MTTGNMIAQPIWKNQFVTISIAGEYLDYEVHDDNDATVYKGRAYPEPGRNFVKIPIAKIVAPHLSGEVTIVPDDIEDCSTWCKMFYLYDTINDEDIATFAFYADWMYGEDGMVNTIEVTSRPMQRVVDPRQYFVMSVGIKDPEAPRPSFGINCGDTTMGRTTMSECSIVTFLKIPTTAKDGDAITVAGIKAPSYKVRKTCADYALYYMNALGGWDYLLIHGNVVRDDRFTRTTMQRSVSTLSYEPDDVIISESTEVSWKLYTDKLNDEQWARMHHLIGSTKVYLHDLNKDTLAAVNVIDSQAVYKTFSNQGKKKMHAEINVKLAKPRYRR